MRTSLLALFSFLPALAAAEPHWHQIPGQPVWVQLPDEWKTAADARRSALSATLPRGGVVTVAIVSTTSSTAETAAEWERLAAGYRDVGVPAIDAKGMRGSGRIGEAQFVLSVSSRDLAVADLPAVEPLTLLVASAAPKSAAALLARDLPRMVAGAVVQWEKPGGGYTTVPGTAIQLREPDRGFETRTVDGGIAVRARDRSVEIEARLVKNKSVDDALARYLKLLDPGGLQWSGAQPLVVKGVGTPKSGRVVTGAAVFQGANYTFSIFATQLEAGVLVLITTSHSAEGAPSPEVPGPASVLRTTPAD